VKTWNIAAACLLLAVLLGCEEDAALSGGSHASALDGTREAASPAGAAEEAAEERFELHIWSPNAKFTAGEPFEVAAELVNLSDEAVNIMHASPLAHFQIYDSNGEGLIKMFMTDQVGIMAQLAPNAPYNPGKKTLKIDQAGTYRIVATASFSLRDSVGQLGEELKVVSAPFEIVVQ